MKKLNLNNNSIKLLNKIFELSYLNKLGVDYIEFRAKHPEELDTLDQLESKQYLDKEDLKYTLTLYGLSFIKSPASVKLLEHFEIIFAYLRDFYQKAPKESLKIADLSKLIKINHNETVEALKYMQKAYWLDSYSGNLYDKENASIKPAEKILRHDSFNDIVLESNKWRDEQEKGNNGDTLHLFHTDQKEKIFSGTPTIYGVKFNFNPIKKWFLSLIKR